MRSKHRRWKTALERRPPARRAGRAALSRRAARGGSIGAGIFRCVCLFVLVAVSTSRAASQLHDFVTVRGDQLFEGDQPFRFLSWDIPNLQMVEDNVPFAESNPWRLPDRFELTDALATVRQMGGTVVRTYVLSVVRTNDA